ncbi:uncharacterized protein [Penaeus vannamei]|uniref:uncharacterized protein n=1 Tax=Penaeus vannamei TaxID=6689 RepID=UPI00387F9C19
MATLPGSDSQFGPRDYVMEAEKTGLEGKAFLHYIQEEEEKRHAELQQYYADRERQRKERRRREAEKRKPEQQEQDKGSMLASVYSARGPHFPFPQFVDGRDNVDSFVQRFENWATQVELPRNHWSARLGNTLSRAALDVFTSLPPNSQLDYDILRKALLARYNLTEGNRKKFQESDREAKKETLLQFMCKLNDHFDRWVFQSGVSQDYEGLKWLMVKEQFLSKCSRELATFVREHALKDNNDLVAHVSLYLEAKGLSMISSPNQGAFTGQPVSKSRVDGYIMKREGGDRRTTTGPPPPRCFRCNRVGHRAARCPFAQQRSGTDRPRERPYTARAAAAGEEELGMDDVIAEPPGDDRLRDSYGLLERQAGYPERNFPVILCTGVVATTAKGRPTLVEGKVGGRKVNVLRDTGCTTVIVKAAHVKNSEYTGKPIRIRLLIEQQHLDASLNKFKGFTEIRGRGRREIW